ncbi:hypothetical protein EXS71_01855 [Candidatus Uhrbacteria bacterium]|nr:hypothetical protein [Candidatus Uhrbacteria bacterium]
MISPRISWLFRRMSRRAKPERSFYLSLQDKLEEAGYFPRTHRTMWSYRWKTICASLSIFLSLTAGTGVYAYASDEVLPDHPLYGLRAVMEGAEVQLAYSSDKQTDIQLKHARRRMREVRLMSLREKSWPPGQRNRFIQSLAHVSVSSTLPTHEILQVEKQELAEIFEQEHEAQTREERVELKRQLREQVEAIDQDLQSLEKHRVRVKKHPRKSETNTETFEDEDEVR